MNFKNIFLVISTIITIGMTGCGSDTNSNAATNRASGFQNLANIPPAILPVGITITASAATLVSTKNTTYGVDVDGNIPPSGLVVKVSYHSNRDIALNDFTSSPFTIKASNTKSGTAIDVRFQWRNIHLSAGDGYFNAKIVPIGGTYHARQLDLNANGYTAATLSYQIDGNSSIGQLDLKVIPGIPDRNFNVLTNGKYEHQFVYMPVKSATRRVWLNNNLGAVYADLNSPDFNPTQQATAANDYKAYGSYFQWGREADGHELMNWEVNSTSRKASRVYGDTSIKSDNPTNPAFITGEDWRTTPDDTLWASELSPNNVCPVGYRLPLNPNNAKDSDNEFDVEVNSWAEANSTAALNSAIQWILAGFFTKNSDKRIYTTETGQYWNGSAIAGGDAFSFYFGDQTNSLDHSSRAYGMPVRCIKKYDLAEKELMAYIKSNGKPTLQEYLKIGILGVTADNLDMVNKALHIAITGNETIDTADDIQNLVDHFSTPLPTGVTIPTSLAVTLVSTLDTTYGVDVDGNIPSSGLVVKVPYHSDNNVVLNSFTSPNFTIDASNINNINNNADKEVSVVFQWNSVRLSAGDGYFDAEIVPNTTYHAKQLDLNTSGYTAATLLYAADEHSTMGKINIKVIPGIPDRNFNVLTNGKYEHQFVYMPIFNLITGRTWLNNNLGAEYADLNNPNGNFNPKQQAIGSGDSLAYGSLFQWERKADGHELINWENNTTGTPKYGTTTIKADNPSDPRFIIEGNGNWRVHADDTLWTSASSPNNVCPAGYRLPQDPNSTRSSDNEFYVEASSWDSQDGTGALLSKLKLSMAGSRLESGRLKYTGSNGLYWSGSYSSNAGNSRDMRLEMNKVFLANAARREIAMSVRCIKDSKAVGLVAYAHGNIQLAPTLQEYLDADITGVTVDNLDVVNKTLRTAVANGENVDTVSDVQSIVDNLPAPLPAGVTITAPTLTTTLVSTKNTTYGIDIDGHIPSSGLVVKVPYHSDRDATLDDFTSSPFTINASNTKSGTAVDVVFQWAHCGINKRFFLSAREIKSDSENMKKRHDSFALAAAY